jgi:transposase InsO family protein
MPWKECLSVDLRREFVLLAWAEESNVAALCRRFGISRKTGYKWMRRFKSAGVDALKDQSRRPRRSPNIMPEETEREVIALRRQHRSWGGRKIQARLRTLGQIKAPSPAAITRALHRHGLIAPPGLYKERAPGRFEHALPNDLWQMDFKGHFALTNGRRCHPLTVLDDHSRYSVLLQACSNEQGQTVQHHLIDAFKRYGLPRRMLSDNGSPWGCSGQGIEEQWTKLTVWLLRLGIQVVHGRPWHPQTQGKEERFHRTLVSDLLKWQALADLAEAQKHFDQFRETYNHVRPHEALEMACPGQRLTVSPRSYPEKLEPVAYKSGELVRKVTLYGRIKFDGKEYAIGRAFLAEAVALRPTVREGLWEVYFCHQRIGWIDQKEGRTLGPRAGRSLAALVTGPHAD